MSSPLCSPLGATYSLSSSELGSLREFLDEHLAMGFIRSSSSAHVSLVLFVCKTDGSLCLCIDFQGLNYRYPLRHISNLLDAPAAFQHFMITVFVDFLDVRVIVTWTTSSTTLQTWPPTRSMSEKSSTNSAQTISSSKSRSNYSGLITPLILPYLQKYSLELP